VILRLQGKRLRVYTRTGDKGKSSLYTGERRRKDDAVFSALGDTDELNSVVGVARQHCVEQGLVTLDEQLREIQSRLLDAGSAIATPTSSASPDALQRAAFGADHARTLEKWIDAMDLELPTLRNFILPVGRSRLACNFTVRFHGLCCAGSLVGLLQPTFIWRDRYAAVRNDE